MTWFARQLKTYSKNGTTVSYTYDANGLRATKTVNGTKSTYVYVNGLLTYEKRGDIEIYFWYDSYGHLMALRCFGITGNPYYYVLTNIQGDVLGIYNGEGQLKVSYEYDTWGNLINMSDTSGVNLGTINPIRYRGYYFDEETGLYYLQSRYYDPQVGRFINADAFVSTGQGLLGNNMFIYCLNNPINYIDRNGKDAETLAWWTGTMWWMCGIDGVLPIGDIIYFGGILLLGVTALIIVEEVSLPEIELEIEREIDIPEPPDVSYPGDDPTQAPDGYEWSGPDQPGGKRGGYKNPSGNDSWHPDLDHGPPIGPHWDYNDSNKHKWRVYPDRIEFVK